MKDAINNLLRKGMEEVGVTPEQAWDKFFEVAYGGDVNKESIRAILEGRIDKSGKGFATFTIDELEDASLMGISRKRTWLLRIRSTPPTFRASRWGCTWMRC
jgi:hypothetical protein